MTSENIARPLTAEATPAMVDDKFISELVLARAQADGLQLTGEGGLLQQLTKRLLESALEGEMSDHLGYDRHDPAGRNGGNSRNGRRRCRNLPRQQLAGLYLRAAMISIEARGPGVRPELHRWPPPTGGPKRRTFCRSGWRCLARLSVFEHISCKGSLRQLVAAHAGTGYKDGCNESCVDH